MSRSAPAWPEGRGLLEGKTLLVTAAAGTGIGFVTARRAAEEGARVMISDFHRRRLGQSAEKLGELTGQRPATGLCDVTSQEQVDALAAAAVSELGHIDVLVNNAGLGGHARIVDMTDEEWHRVIDVTLHGTMRMTRAVLPHMMERETGVIVNNASVLGWRAQEGQSHYAAAKAGVMALTRCAAIEAAEVACASTRWPPPWPCIPSWRRSRPPVCSRSWRRKRPSVVRRKCGKSLR